MIVSVGISSWLLIPFVSFLIIYLIFNYKPKIWKEIEKTIPGPPKLPVLGNAFQLNIPNERIIPTIGKWFEIYGNRLLVAVGSKSRVILRHRKDYEKVLSSPNHIDKSYHYDFFQPWLGQALLTSTGNRWLKQRKLLTPAFHFRILENFLEVMNEQASTLIHILDEKHGDGNTKFQMLPYVSKCAFGVISETAMGTKLHAQDDIPANITYLKAIQRLPQLMIHRAMRPWLFRDFIWNLSAPGREMKQKLEIVHNFTDNVIRERKLAFQDEKSKTFFEDLQNNNENISIKQKRLAFLDLLLETQANDETKSFTDEDIRFEVNTFLFGGHDTTSMNLAWSVFTIGSHPNVQAKVQEEIDAVLGSDLNKSITSSDLVQLKYLEACIKETLRIYPSIPIISRDVKIPLALDEKTIIPKGATVVLYNYFLHRDPEIFPDPESFQPDRFLGENAIGRHPFAYVPFSAGPRNCIGQKYAMMELKVVLANIFRKFNVTTHTDFRKAEAYCNMSLTPVDGIPVTITRRYN